MVENQNLSELNIYLDKVRQLFHEQKDQLSSQIESLTTENSLLQSKLLLCHSQNMMFKKENAILNEGLTSLKKELHKRIVKLKQQNQKLDKWKDKIFHWQSFLNNILQNCTCDVKKNIELELIDMKAILDSNQVKPLHKTNSVLQKHVFLQSPPKKSAKIPPTLVQMTEQCPEHYNACSTPVWVGKTKCNFQGGGTVGSDDESIWSSSPSVLSDRKKADSCQERNNLKSMHCEKPVNSSKRVLEYTEEMETSKDLFSDSCVIVTPVDEVDKLLIDGDKGFAAKTARTLNTIKKVKALDNRESECSTFEDSWLNDNENYNLINEATKLEIDTAELSLKANTPSNNDDCLLMGVLKNKPRKQVNYKFSEVVRKKNDRELLNGYECKECRRYYASDNLTASQLREKLKTCSKHRHASTPPPDTPASFWEIDFPSTQECIDRGYMLTEKNDLPNHANPKFTKKLNKRIKYQ